MPDSNYCMVGGFPQGTISRPWLIGCLVLFGSNSGWAMSILGSRSWFWARPLFGHALGTWGIMPKVTTASQRHQATGNKCTNLTTGTLSTCRASCQDQWPRLPDLSRESILLFLLVFSASLVFLFTLRYT